jgi:hypothetical protein
MAIINTLYDFHYGEPGPCLICGGPLTYPFL